MENQTIELIKQLPKNVTSINFVDGKIESIYFDVEKDGISEDSNNNLITLSNPDTNPITEIKKGDSFLCIEDYVMDDGSIAYARGYEYVSDFDKCITDNEANTSHRLGVNSKIDADPRKDDSCNIDNYFIRIN